MNFLNNTIIKSLLVFLIVILSSCSIQNKIKQTVPEWTISRPRSDFYYIGIAKVDKKIHPTDYLATAKKLALTDLSSEISIHIESNSLLSSYENNNHFDSDYQQYIKSETEKDLSGFELVETYETPKIYQVYYRLSKNRWSDIQADRKSIAIRKARNLYSQAVRSKQELNYLTAIRFEINALLELRKYWNESLTYKNGDSVEHIDMQIKNDLFYILSNIKIKADKTRILLNSKNHFKGKIALSVINSTGDNLKAFPMELSYKKKDFPYQKLIYSDERSLNVGVSDVDFSKQGLDVEISLIKEKILNINIEDQKLLSFVDDAFNKNPLIIPIDIEYPKVFINDSSGVKPQSEFMYYLQNGVKTILIENHFSIADSLSGADMDLIITTNQSEGTGRQRYKQIDLNYGIEVKTVNDNETVFSKYFPKLKAIDLTYKKAEEKVYKKAANEFRDEYAKLLIDGLIR